MPATLPVGFEPDIVPEGFEPDSVPEGFEPISDDQFRPAIGERSFKEVQTTPSLRADILPPGADRSPQSSPTPTIFEAGPANAIAQAEQERVSQTPALTGPEIEEALFTGVPVPTIGKEGTALRGVSEVLSGVGSALTSPGGLLVAGATAIPGVAPVAGLYFGAEAAKAAGEKAGEASVTGSPQTTAEAVTLGALGALAAHSPFKSAADINVPARRLAAEINRAVKYEPLPEPNLLPLSQRILSETKTETVKPKEPNAPKIEVSTPSVLRQGGQEMGLPQMGQGNAKPEIPARTGEAKTEVVQPAPSVGAAAKVGSEEFGQGTSLKNETGRLERALHGLPEEYPGETQKMLPAWVRAGEALSKEPDLGRRLAEELKQNPERGLTGDESALLLRHKTALENAKNDAAELTFSSDPAVKVEAERAYMRYSDELLDLLDTVKFRGTQAGRELRWRQAIAFEDYSFETMRRNQRVAMGRELTPEETSQIKTLHDRLAELEQKLKEKESKQTQQGRQTGLDEAVTEATQKAKTESSKDKAAGVERDIPAEKQELIQNINEQFKNPENEGDFSGASSSIQKLMELFAMEGIRERVPMEQAVHSVLKEIDPSISLELTQDLMSGYGKFKPLSKDPIKVVVRGIKGEIQQVRKLLDFFKGQAPSKTGAERRIPTDKERELQKVVNEAKKRFGTVATDPAKALKSALDAIETRLKNRLADLKQEVATRKKIVKERAPTPYNEETIRLRKEIEEVQKQHDEIFGRPELTPEQRLKIAEDSAFRQEKELQRQLRTGEIFPKGKIDRNFRSEILDATKARIEALKEERQWAREAAQPKPEIADVEAAKRGTQLDKEIESLETQIRTETVFPKGKKPSPEETAANQARLDRIKALKEERQFIRERLQPKPEPEAKLLQQILTRLRQQEARYTERLAKADFEKRVKKEQPTSPEVLDARARVEKVKLEFQKGLHAAQMAKRTRGQKIWDGIKKARGAMVNIVSSYDFSAPRQALFALLSNVGRIPTNPIGAGKMLTQPFVEGIRALKSEKLAERAEQRIKDRDNFKTGVDKISEVEYTELNPTKFTKYEENAHSILDEWASLPIRTGNITKTAITAPFKVAIRGVRASNRGFSTFLNSTRAGLLDELLSVNFKDRAPTEAELKAVGNLVNIATGRGKLNPKTAQLASEVLWSPKLLASRIQALTGQPFYDGTARTRAIVAKEYARAIGAGYLLWATSRYFDEKDETNPTSSDFGKIVRGNVRIDPWGGFQQVTVLGARTALQEKKTLKGKEQDIGAARKYGVPGVWQVWSDFGRTKLRPDIGAAVDLLSGQNFKGDPTTIVGTLESALVPLPMRDITDILKSQGFTEGMITEALGIFGAGVSQYKDREAQR